MSPRAAALPAVAVLALALGACSSSGGSAATSSGSGATGAASAVAVTSSDSACELSATEGTAGQIKFTVKNTGGQVTEFYVLADGGARIVGEVENIGPELTRDLTVVLKPGDYTTACKPGMAGDGIQAAFKVSGDASVVTESEELSQAATEYRAYVANEAQTLETETAAFVAAVKAGDIDKAKALYAPTRMHYERIEPVAESFGDLDPRIDARKNDVEDGQKWTGWHRIEKALWVDGSLKGMAPYADQLLTDTKHLVAKVGTIELAADQITNGAKELLDEVATSKVTGEEERYSHTDLWSFQANVEGAKKAYDVVAPVVATKDPALKTKLDTAFAELQTELDLYKVGDGFVLYTDLTDAQVKALAAKVEALSEPLSELTVTVVS